LRDFSLAAYLTGERAAHVAAAMESLSHETGLTAPMVEELLCAAWRSGARAMCDGLCDRESLAIERLEAMDSERARYLAEKRSEAVLPWPATGSLVDAFAPEFANPDGGREEPAARTEAVRA